MGLLDEAIREHLDLKRRNGADPADIERMEREALGPVRRLGSDTAESERVDRDALDDATGAARAQDGLQQPQTGDGFEGAPEFPTEPAVGAEVPEPTHEEQARKHGKRRFGLFGRRHDEPEEEPEFEPEHGHGPEQDYASEHGFESEPGYPETDYGLESEPDYEEPELDYDEEEPRPTEPERPAEDTGIDDPDATREFNVPTEEPFPEDEPDSPRDYGDTDRPEHGPDEPGQKSGEDPLEETPDFLQDTPEHDRLWFEQKPPNDFDFGK
jgi:hypothetical protein